MRRSISQRRTIAAEVREARAEVTEAATADLLARHPDGVESYGPAARARGIEDAGHHLDFLAAAIEGGEPDAFAAYCRWARQVMVSRGVAAERLHENVAAIRDALLARSSHDTAEEVARVAARGLEAINGDSAPAPGRTNGSVEQRAYLAAALKGDRQAALNVAREQVDSGWSHLDLYADLLEACQRRVGELWAANEITVAEEHMATAVTQFVLTALFESIPPAAERRGRAVVCCAEGERHQVGAHLVADALEADGWSAVFLGSDMPVADAAQAIAEHRPDLLGISVTILANLDGAVRLVDAVRTSPDPTPRLLLGGQAVRLLPSLGNELQAVAAGDVRDAVAQARELAPGAVR